MIVNKRLTELEADLELTKILYKRLRNKQVRQSINNLRYLIIKEKNLISRGWDEL